jgi:hypothetical protein
MNGKNLLFEKIIEFCKTQELEEKKCSKISLTAFNLKR